METLRFRYSMLSSVLEGGESLSVFLDVSPSSLLLKEKLLSNFREIFFRAPALSRMKEFICDKEFFL